MPELISMVRNSFTTIILPSRHPVPPVDPSLDKSVLPSLSERGAGDKGARLDGNLIVHGDNLHALKSLLPMYAGKVDCIFIDPPYWQ